MASKEYFCRLLNKTIDSSCNVNDVFKLLRFVPMIVIKSVIKQQIKAMNLDEIRKAYYTVTSIDDIFPSDITQHIISFNESKDTYSIFSPISKSFKKYTQKNEEIYIQQLTNIENTSVTPWDKTVELKYLRITSEMNEISQRRIKLQNENPNSNAYEIKSLYSALTKFENRLNKMKNEVYSYRMARSQLNKNSQTILLNKNNSILNKSTCNIWIIDKNRNALNSEEMKLFCNGPFANFEQVMNEIESGDKIYIYNDFELGIEINKSVQIIGVGNNNKLINCNVIASDRNVLIRNKSKVFFENIKFDILGEDCYRGIKIENECELHVNNSIFEFKSNAIYHYSDPPHNEINIVITNCDFYGGRDSVQNAIDVTAIGSLNVQNCMFVNCTTQYEDYYTSESVIYFYTDSPKKLKIKCIGNKFIDNTKYPIGTMWRLDNDEIDIELKNNYLIGYNGIYVDQIVSDANQFYRMDSVRYG